MLAIETRLALLRRVASQDGLDELVRAMVWAELHDVVAEATAQACARYKCTVTPPGLLSIHTEALEVSEGLDPTALCNAILSMSVERLRALGPTASSPSSSRVMPATTTASDVATRVLGNNDVLFVVASFLDVHTLFQRLAVVNRTLHASVFAAQPWLAFWRFRPAAVHRDLVRSPSECARLFGRWQQLRCVHVCHDEVDDELLVALTTTCSALEVLEMEEVPVTDDGLARALAACTRLRKLAMKGLPHASLSPLAEIKTLDELIVDSCPHAAAAATWPGGLRRVHLVNLRRTDTESIARLIRDHHVHLEDLALRDHVDLQQLPDLPRTLRSLDLHLCVGLSSLACLSPCASLLSVNLSAVDLGDEQLEALVDSCPAVEELNLGRWRSLTDAGLSHLTELAHLRSLDISHCGGNVTDASVLAVLRSQTTTLRCLRVAGLASVTEAVLHAVVRGGAPCVEVLDMRGCYNVVLTAPEAEADVVPPCESGLRELMLGGCLSVQCIPEALSRQLTTLDVSGTAVKRLPLHCESLQHINISKIQSGVSVRDALNSAPRLRSLIARNHALEDLPDDDSMVASTLRELDVSFATGGNDTWSEKLVMLFPKLERLVLEGVEAVCDDDLLVFSRGCAHLHSLSVRGCRGPRQQSFDALAHLAAHSLEHLDLRDAHRIPSRVGERLRARFLNLNVQF